MHDNLDFLNKSCNENGYVSKDKGKEKTGKKNHAAAWLYLQCSINSKTNKNLAAF